MGDEIQAAAKPKANSFWLTLANGQCHIGTCTFRCYRFKTILDALEFSAEFVLFGDCAASAMPESLMAKYELTEVDFAAIETLPELESVHFNSRLIP